MSNTSQTFFYSLNRRLINLLNRVLSNTSQTFFYSSIRRLKASVVKSPYRKEILLLM
ncbi:MAG: hypothetical protein ACOCV8_04935 [Spirochaetota bacterium]